MGVSPDFVALVVLAVLGAGAYFGLWERLGLKNRTVASAAAELDIANTTIDRLRHERNQAREQARQLEATRSLEPVLAQLSASAEIEKQVLDRLVHHNGSFAHMEASMKELIATIREERQRARAEGQEMVESLKLLTGFLAGLAELPTASKGTN